MSMIALFILVVCRPDMTQNLCLMITLAIRDATNLTDNIIDQLKDDPSALRRCSLVAPRWRARAQRWLFEVIVIQLSTNPWLYPRWIGEPMPGMVRGGPRVAYCLIDDLLYRVSPSDSSRARTASRPIPIVHVAHTPSLIPYPAPIHGVQRYHLAIASFIFDPPLRCDRYANNLWTPLPHRADFEPRGTPCYCNEFVVVSVPLPGRG